MAREILPADGPAAEADNSDARTTSSLIGGEGTGQDIAGVDKTLAEKIVAWKPAVSEGDDNPGGAATPALIAVAGKLDGAGPGAADTATGVKHEMPAASMVLAAIGEDGGDKEGEKNDYAAPKAAPVVPEAEKERIVRVRKGNTLSSILAKAGVPPLVADKAIAAVRKVYNPRRLKPGQEITLTFGPPQDKKGRLAFLGLSLAKGFDRIVGARRDNSGAFSSVEIKKDLKTFLSRAEGVIHDSLSRAALGKGVPRDVLAEMIATFSYDVDFQRDIQVNDSFELLFEELYDGNKKIPHSGKLVFASLTLSGVRMPIYRFQTKNGTSEFFSEKGESVRKALLRTPIDGARLSSRYGKRRHPILGYSKMHRGLDFAASPGTPIRAAGKGVVARAGRNGAYGNYIKIRHNSEFSTAYAHLSRYAKGIRKGRRVKQGEIIGYTGSTGRSTGPHLHFEVIRLGARINPLSVKVPSGKKLTDGEFANFLQTMENIKREYAAIPQSSKVARSE